MDKIVTRSNGKGRVSVGGQGGQSSAMKQRCMHWRAGEGARGVYRWELQGEEGSPRGEVLLPCLEKKSKGDRAAPAACAVLAWGWSAAGDRRRVLLEGGLDSNTNQMVSSSGSSGSSDARPARPPAPAAWAGGRIGWSAIRW